MSAARAVAPGSVPASPARTFMRSRAGVLGLGFLVLMLVLCVGTLPWTLGWEPTPEGGRVPRYNAGDLRLWGLPPVWWPVRNEETIMRLNALVPPNVLARVAAAHGIAADEAVRHTRGQVADELRACWPAKQRPVWAFLGTDVPNGRSLLIRLLAGGGVSLGIGLAAALISVVIGTLYGAAAAYAGGRTDALLMRIVDVLYGLPYILLVVLLAVASDAVLDEYVTRSRARQQWIEQQAAVVARERGMPVDRRTIRALLEEDAVLRERLEGRAAQVPQLQPRQVSEAARTVYDVVVLLTAIGGVSWLTMARVVRGQVLSLKAQPFMEAARAIGVPWRRQFTRHLLPNLLGPIIVYATLTVPQAILQESFLSFLGIGVRPPLPSWGNLAAEGLREINPYRSYWWLLVFPCLMLALTLLALNFVGEGLREAFDPRRRRPR